MNPLPHNKNETSATITPTLVLVLAGWGLLAFSAYAAAPSWWATRNATNASLGTNDYAVATQGQLKQFTARAVDELNADLTNGGAGPDLSNIVYGWQQDYLTNGYATNTANPTRPYKPADFQAVTVGQLKYIASLLDNQLANNGYTGFTPPWLQVNTNTDNTVAVVGQIKEVFDFDLSIAPSAVTGLAVSNNNPGELDLTWTLPTPNNGNAITINQSLDGGITYTLVATINPSSTSYAVTGLSVGTTAFFQVTLLNTVGSTTVTSALSSPVIPPSRYVVIDLGQNFLPKGITSQAVVGGNGPPTNNLTGALIPQIWQAGTLSYLNTNYTTGPVPNLAVVGMSDATNASGYTVFGQGTFTGPGTNSTQLGYGPIPFAAIWPGGSSAPVPIVGGAQATPWANTGTYAEAISAQGFVVGVEGVSPNPPFRMDVNSPTNSVYPLGGGATGYVDWLLGSGIPGTVPYAAGGTHNWCGYVRGNSSYTNIGPIVDGTTYTAYTNITFDAINSSNYVAGWQYAGGTNNAIMAVPGSGTSIAITNLGGGNVAYLNDHTVTNTMTKVTGGVPSVVTNVVYSPQAIGSDNSSNPMLWDQTDYNGFATNVYVAKNLNHLLPQGIAPSPAPWTLTAATGINNAGDIVGTATKTSDGTTHGVMLLPVKLINLLDPYLGSTVINNPGHNGQSTPIIITLTHNPKNLNAVAWIAAHDPNNVDPASGVLLPRMPSLKAVVPAPIGTTVWWKLSVIFHGLNGKTVTPYRSFDTGTKLSPTQITQLTNTGETGAVGYSDDIAVPLPSGSGDTSGNAGGWLATPDGWVTNAAGIPWNIYKDNDWQANTNRGFFGGDAMLSTKITTTSGTTILPEQDWYFRIAGENPNITVTPSPCKTYILTADPTKWWAYAIAKHETKGDGGRTYYNQFFDNGAPAGISPKPGMEGIPDWNNDGSKKYPASGTGGRGLFQLTYKPKEANFIMCRDWIWNWPKNVLQGISDIQGKYSTAVTYVAGQRAIASGPVPKLTTSREANPDSGDRSNPHIPPPGQPMTMIGGDAVYGYPTATATVSFYDTTTKPAGLGELIEAAESIKAYNGLSGGFYVQWINSAWQFNRARTSPPDNKSYVDLISIEIEAPENHAVPP